MYIPYADAVSGLKQQYGSDPYTISGYGAPQDDWDQFQMDYNKFYAKGGRIGYKSGLKVVPKAGFGFTKSEGQGSEVDERDISYGGSGLYQGDKAYVGGDYMTGNVNVNVQKDGNTVFQDTMSKEDMTNLYFGLGQKEGDRVEVGTDRKGNYTLNIVKSFNNGGLAKILGA